MGLGRKGRCCLHPPVGTCVGTVVPGPLGYLGDARGCPKSHPEGLAPSSWVRPGEPQSPAAIPRVPEGTSWHTQEPINHNLLTMWSRRNRFSPPMVPRGQVKAARGQKTLFIMLTTTFGTARWSSHQEASRAVAKSQQRHFTPRELGQRHHLHVVFSPTGRKGKPVPISAPQCGAHTAHSVIARASCGSLGCQQPNLTRPNSTQPDPTQFNPTQPNQIQPNSTQPNATQPNQIQPYPTQPNPTQPHKSLYNLQAPLVSTFSAGIANSWQPAVLLWPFSTLCIPLRSTSTRTEFLTLASSSQKPVIKTMVG